MEQETIIIIVLLAPILIGGVIAAVNAPSVNNTTEKAEAWARRTQKSVSVKTGWVYRYVVNPLLWMLVKFSDWTDSFTHHGLKNGVRVMATLYLILLWCFFIYAAFMIMLISAIAALVIYVFFKILINYNSDVKGGYDATRKILGSVGKGKRINPETGRVQEEGFLGWKDTDQRIDPETGKIQKEGMFGWNDSGTKVNQETGNIQKEGLLGYNDTETRINPDTGIIQKKGFLGWDDTDERIEQETGRRQKKGFLGWDDQ